MIRHVVLWKFKDCAEGASMTDNRKKATELLYALRPIIPEIKRMEIGADISRTEMSYDLLLLTEFDTQADLKTYAEHPEHLQVAKFIRAVTESRVVLDCEI